RSSEVSLSRLTRSRSSGPLSCALSAIVSLAEGEFDSHMTKRWLIALFIAALFSGKTFADCVPSPDTPASVIEYFQKFNKPLPEQFCAKEDAAPQASEEPSQEPPQAGPSKLECEMTLAATRNALATLGRLEKTLDAAA